MKKSILIAPNEDGFGTSAWTVGLVRALAQQDEITEVRVVVATGLRFDFHHHMYDDLINVSVVELPLSQPPIQVAKRDGEVDVPRTIEEAIVPYTSVSAEYAQLLAQHELLQGVDLVIDLGVPALVRAAWAENGRRQQSGQPLLRIITLFDHAWSLTLQRIAGEALPPEGRAELAAMAADEALTNEVLLFGDPVAPKLFHEYWQVELQRPLTVIPGVLGGPGRTLAIAGLPGQNAAAARRVARRLLGLSEAPTMFISGGGTTVWHDVMGDLLDSYLAEPPPYQVVVFNPAEARRGGVVMQETAVSFLQRTLHVYRGKLGPLTFIGSIRGETHHVLFAAYDLVITRAGGGTVSDAVAHRAPLLLVEEPGMWQVAQIQQACVRLGLAESVALAEFQTRGRSLVEDASGNLRQLAAQQQAMTRIPHHVEEWLISHLI